MGFQKKFIVVEGPIGVGKTTLAAKLARTFNCKTMLENFVDNPFLKKFYQDPKKYALPTQLYFLLKRSQQYVDYKLKRTVESCIVSDYFLEKDKLFAKTILDTDELDLYTKIYNNLGLKSLKPDLIIYLQASPDTLLTRIKSRSISYEQGITNNYINDIVDAYTNYFHEYKESPLLIINTSNVNINKSHDYTMLTNEIRKNIKGKKYFNPTDLDD